LIGIERKRIFGGSALESFGRSCYWKTKQHEQQGPNPSKEKTAWFAVELAGRVSKADQSA